MSNDETIGTRHLPSFLQEEPLRTGPDGDGRKIALDRPFDFNLHALEMRAVQRALKHAGGNRTKAAELLGISRRTLQRKLKEAGD